MNKSQSMKNFFSH